MKIHIFGSLSGMNPIPGRTHTAWALEHNSKLYWFDAGENCSRTAFYMGLNTNQIAAIFISHFHSDHWAGLVNLLGSIRYKEAMPPVEVYTPEPNILPRIKSLMEDTDSFYPGTTAIEKPLTSSPILIDDVKVTSWQNQHWVNNNGVSRSKSFLIEVNKVKILYSGDVKSFEELFPYINDCHVLLMETGHHNPVNLTRQFKHRHYKFKKLIFLHHGRDIINNYLDSWNQCRDIWDRELYFAEDAQSFDLNTLQEEVNNV